MKNEKEIDGSPAAQERRDGVSGGESWPVGDDLLERARWEDAGHWEEHQRPNSAETLRKRLRVGAARSRMLVALVRADSSG